MQFIIFATAHVFVHNSLSLIDIYLRQDLRFLHFLLWRRSDKLSAKLDNEFDINLKLSTNFSLYLIVLSLSSSFLTGTEKVIPNWPSNYFASTFIINF